MSMWCSELVLPPWKVPKESANATLKWPLFSSTHAPLLLRVTRLWFIPRVTSVNKRFSRRGGVVKVQSASRYNPGQTIPAKTPSPSRAPWCFWAERRSRVRSGTLRRKSTVTANDDVSLPRQRQLRGGGRWLCCRKQHGGNRLGMLTGN